MTLSSSVRFVGAVLVAAALALPATAFGTDVAVVGLFPGKAVLVIDGGPPRTVAVGARAAEGVKLLGIDDSGALVEVDGKRQHLRLGEHAVTSATDNRGGNTINLTADASGHFLTIGSINGSSVRFLVDTGATLISIGASDAARAGVDHRKGEPGITMTANGQARVWHVKLRTVKVGDVTLRDVDAAVHEQDMPIALLGMSFLNRMEMKREGTSMTLRQRY